MSGLGLNIIPFGTIKSGDSIRKLDIILKDFLYENYWINPWERTKIFNIVDSPKNQKILRSNESKITSGKDNELTSDLVTSAFAKTGVYVPLYIYPGGSGMGQWDLVINTKLAHPSVPFVVTINPSNGVGNHREEKFVKGIRKLKNVGITVIGYVYTSYGEREFEEIKFEITKYKEWYDLDGIMFDEMSNQRGFEEYYKSLTDYAKSLGLKFIKGNPGTNVPTSYVNVVDNFLMYENSGYPILSKLKDLHLNHDKRNLSFVSYGVSSLDISYVTEATTCVGLMYITDNVMPNPYDSIPNYFENLVSILDSQK